MRHLLTIIAAIIVVSCGSTPNAPTTIRGDVNGDGIVCKHDADMVEGYVMRGEYLEDPALGDVADYNGNIGNGYVTMHDVSWILAHADVTCEI